MHTSENLIAIRLLSAKIKAKKQYSSKTAVEDILEPQKFQTEICSILYLNCNRLYFAVLLSFLIFSNHLLHIACFHSPFTANKSTETQRGPQPMLTSTIFSEGKQLILTKYYRTFLPFSPFDYKKRKRRDTIRGLITLTKVNIRPFTSLY